MGSFILKIALILLISAACVWGSNQQCYEEFSQEQYLGCFVDNPNRILQKIFVSSKTNSVPACIKYCAIRNYAIAGVEYTGECFCDNAMVQQQEAPEAECNMKCSGSHENCGGPWRISVYKTEKVHFNEFKEQYEGCFVDARNRILPSKLIVSDQTCLFNCLEFCKNKGYKYAGVEYSTECFCGNKLHGNVQKVDENDCNMACSGCNAKCGGGWRINIYNTDNIPSVEDQYEGCYVDAPNRILPNVFKVFHDNCADNCIRHCGQLGYKYAGVEYYKECFCGNEFHGNVQKVHDGDCNTPCAGCDKNCGGGWRISIYRTETPFSEDELTANYADGCNDCQCAWVNGAFVSECTKKVCPSLNCQEQEQLPGKCCPSCKQGCFENGVEYKDGDIMPTSDPCETCTCKHQNDSAAVMECLIIACNMICAHGIEDDGTCCGKCKEEEDECDPEKCPEPKCKSKQRVKTDDMCCEECMCRKGKTYINPGPFGDECEGCVCKNGEISCKPPSCPKLKCVDPVKEDGGCCYKCPKGVSCMHKKKTIYASTPLSDKKNEYMCDPKDWSPNPWIRKKKIPGKTLKQLKKFKNIIDLP